MKIKQAKTLQRGIQHITRVFTSQAFFFLVSKIELLADSDTAVGAVNETSDNDTLKETGSE